MEIIIFVIALSLALVSYCVQRYIMKLSNKDILEILKFDLKTNGISGISNIILGIFLVFAIIIFGPAALILLVLYLIIFI